MNLIAHPVFPSMITIGHRAIAATTPVPHDPSTPAPIGDEAGTPDETAVQTTLVIIAKGTFAVDDSTSTPVEQQVSVLDADDTLPSLPAQPPPPAVPPLMLEESDLAVFKPRADLIVRGTPQPPDPPEAGATLIGGFWDEAVAIGAQTVENSFAPGPQQPMTFGWQVRNEGTRLGRAGRYGPSPHTDFVSSGRRLPVDFSNLFFNGADEPFLVHPEPNADVVVSTSGDFDLPGGGGTAVVTESVTLHLPAQFPVAIVRYRDALGRHEQDELAMAADTIVYDKTGTTFTVTWRANFDFLSVPGDRYGDILVSGGG